MTKEELEKEAEKHADGIYHYKINVSDYGEDGIINYRYSDVKEAYLAGAEPREKRIAELERKLKVKTELNQRLGVAYREYEQLTKEQDEHLAELERKLEQLERKLEQTEKDLADYQFNYPTIKELQKENAELKESCKIQVDTAFQMIYDKDEQLTNAKELLNEFMRISKASDEDFEHDYSELIGETEQFLSEVENVR